MEARLCISMYAQTIQVNKPGIIQYTVVLYIEIMKVRDFLPQNITPTPA